MCEECEVIEEVEEPEEIETDEKIIKKIIKELTKENENLSKSYDELNDRYLRTLAEYDNYRKRTLKERDGIYADAYSEVIKEILPIIDNLERALLFSEDEGIKLTYNQCVEIFKRLGIEEIETLKFDPEFHHAVMHTEDENYGENEIIEVFQKGYKLGEKIIRYAMVKVAN
ncbi:MAG: nucleotide exchange factor GrpE [Oscillospiraceae bacterium]|nr:nucleotide exchange factor GrpE [Oscillospiraceae bacterium]